MAQSWDQTTMASTMRSVPIVSRRMPREPDSPMPNPSPAIAPPASQTGTESPRRATRKPSRQRRARADQNGDPDVESRDFPLAEERGEVQWQRSFDRPQRERNEEDPRAGEEKRRRPQRGSVGTKNGPLVGLSQEPNRPTGGEGQPKVEEERRSYPTRGSEAGARDAADRVGGEDTRQALVLLTAEAFERGERHPHPKSARTDSHDEARGEVGGQMPVAEHEAEAADGHEHDGGAEDE